ncbi:type I-E CRISPR-associated protein Cse1/CasA [Amorphus sp. 3PC139-8]|uniref:type I-E CRISPR-associated protein Cse1/CasA n=1 Tax=Amorphus sp. 3PC139-8 TaxID=2735676 RepID=UPI00345CC954
MNLIDDAWIPIERRSGTRMTIPPHEVVSDFHEDPVVRLSFGRPDWDLAVSEWLIGILAVALHPRSDEDWAETWLLPPTSDDLQRAFSGLTPAFNLFGSGAACYQDFETLDDGRVWPAAQLYFDAPGDQTLKNNAAVFQRRAEGGLDPSDAAAALIAHQAFATSAGKGHRTSLRGGGPLVTLLELPCPINRPKLLHGTSTLWDKLWPNVSNVAEEPTLDDRLFPWMGPTRTSTDGEEVRPETDAHQLMAFFATPRRIRLMEGADGMVHSCRRVTYGANYAGWRHPLSPYYLPAGGGEPLPVHPRTGARATYRDWLGVTIGTPGQGDLRALPLRAAPSRLDTARRLSGDDLHINAIVVAQGYDCEKATINDWLFQQIPFFPLTGDRLTAFTSRASAAGSAASIAQNAVRLARYGQRDPSDPSRFNFAKNKPAHLLSEIGLGVWTDTEADFSRHLAQLATFEPSPDAEALVSAQQSFSNCLRRAVRRQFREAVGIARVEDASPQRLAAAARFLEHQLGDESRFARTFEKTRTDEQEVPT